MVCRLYRDQLSAYADGELSGMALRAVERHVQRCAACTEEVQSVKRLHRLASSIPMDEAPVALHNRILGGLAYAGVPVVVPTPARSYRPATRALTLAAVCSTVFVGVGVLQPIFRKSDIPSAGLAVSSRGEVLPPRRMSGADSHELTPAPAPATAHSEAGGAVPVPFGTERVAVSPDKSAAPDPASIGKTGLVRVGAAGKPNGPASPTGPQPQLSPPVAADVAVTPNTPMILVDTSSEAPDAQVAVSVPDEAPESPVAPADGESSVRMVGMSIELPQPREDDEGLSSLRSFLEDRNRSIPQPPAAQRKERRSAL